jgi:hypothetical protein
MISVISSLYTYTTLSLSNNSLAFIGCSDSNIAMSSTNLGSHDEVFFILRVSSCFTESAVTRLLTLLCRGVFFVLGEHPTLKAIADYFTEEGVRILRLFILPRLTDPILLDFAPVHYLDWFRFEILSCIAELCVLRSEPAVIGISCFVKDAILSSYSPIEIADLFSFAPIRLHQSRVYLSPEMQAQLQAPAECLLMQVRDGDVRFYLLTRTELSDEAIGPLTASLASCSRAIVQLAQDPVFGSFSPNSLVYDGKLRRVLMGSVSERLKENAVLAHDLFEQNPRLQEVLLQTPDELTHGKRCYSMEQFRSVGVTDTSFNDLYDEVLKIEVQTFKNPPIVSSGSKSEK